MAAIPSRTAVILLFLALWSLHPIGYLGGGGDDYHYLVAARCLAEQGWCVPADHWARRWPVVAPTAAMLRLFGEAQVAIAVAPLAYASAALALLVGAVARRFGEPAGLFAGLAMALTPLFVTLAPVLGIDVVELAFVLGSVACLQRAAESERTAPALWAGVLMGLAVQARPTALAAVPLLLVAAAVARRRDWLVPLAIGVAGPQLGEAAVYAAGAGDPLLGWRLSLAHTTIASAELSRTVDVRESPLFNPHFIAGWRPASGIAVHWSVDGLLNLLASPLVALTLAVAAAVTLLEWRGLPRGWAGRRSLLLIAAAAAWWFVALTYALAVDPKPRMFLPVLAVASVWFGVMAARRWRTRPGLIVGILALLTVKGVATAYDRSEPMAQADTAVAWIAADPALTIEPRTARFLALVPAAARLPLFDGRASAHHVLLLGEGNCARAAAEVDLPGWRTLRERAVVRPDAAPVAWLRAHAILFAPRPPEVLCVGEVSEVSGKTTRSASFPQAASGRAIDGGKEPPMV